MKVATAVIHAGVCGFVTRVRAASDDDFVRLEIGSNCEKVRAFAEELAQAGPLNALDEITLGHESVLLTTAARHCRGCCAACVAADGAFKAMQVAAGLALPAPVRIELTAEG
ncbi:MAG: hypothetical protein K6V36_09260 [Anaerolineae bacterium]|nr:hypothetical protein [Anaerolineae bacterium]